MSKNLSIPKIHQTLQFIESKPRVDQLVKFLSRNLDPEGEITGICSYEVNEQGILEYGPDFGFPYDLDKSIEISAADDNPLSIALRTGILQIVDMNSLYSEYVDATHKELQMEFRAGMAMPVNSKSVFGVLIKNSFSQMIRYRDYFECMSECLKLWYQHITAEAFTKNTHSNPENRELSERQSRIIELIKEHRTNYSIAQILGFSESLIRQETIAIYRKLGIRGRRDLLANPTELVEASS